jgi:hypothetical protein
MSEPVFECAGFIAQTLQVKLCRSTRLRQAAHQLRKSLQTGHFFFTPVN